jgi:hypothetical protein
VIVDALKGVLSARRLSDVCEKIGELEPAVADGDAATAVALIMPLVWVEASLFIAFQSV